MLRLSLKLRAKLSRRWVSHMAPYLQLQAQKLSKIGYRNTETVSGTTIHHLPGVDLFLPFLL